jgi:hypothetical protein
MVRTSVMGFKPGFTGRFEHVGIDVHDSGSIKGYVKCINSPGLSAIVSMKDRFCSTTAGGAVLHVR